MTLFDECIEALGKKCNTLDRTMTQQIFEEFEYKFPMTMWGQIDWNKSEIINQGVYSYEFFHQLQDYFKNKQDDVFIIWDEIALPIVETKIDVVLEVIDDVTAVSFNTWIYFRKENKVIEIYHDGNITVGKVVV